MQQPMPNPDDIQDLITTMNMDLALMAKAFKLNYSTPTNNNQRILSNPRNRQIAQPGMNMGQDRQMKMNVENPDVQNGVNQNRIIVVLGIANQNANQIRNGNVVVARAEGNVVGNNEAGIQLQAKEFDFIAAVSDLDKIKEVNANYILMANLQQVSTSGTQTDKAPVYDSDGSVENDSNVISEVPNVEQYAKVEKVNSVNRKMKETNIELTTALARYKNQEKCFETSQETNEKLERCYHKSVYQEQCLTKKINALHLSSGKQITALNEEISNLNNQLSKKKATVSSLLKEKKKLKSDFKIR
ncbi:hypothetical protein Tco_1035588 [Tanacetum coccineum]